MRYKNFSVILLLTFVLAVLMVLGGSLSGIVFQPGQPFRLGWNWNFTVVTNLGNLPGGDLLLNFIELILLSGVIFLPVTILYLILSPKARKQFLREVIRVVPIVLLFIFIAKVISQQPITNKQFDLSAATDSPIELPSPTQTVTNITTPPHWIVHIITLTLAFILTGLIFWGIWTLWNHRHKKTPIEQIANQVERALNALQDRGDLKNIIIRCYFEMSQVLNHQRGIRRETAMTPHEFELRLRENGFPEQPIQQITRLFEQVRYGTLHPGVTEENLAVASLNEIIKFCHNPI